MMSRGAALILLVTLLSAPSARACTCGGPTRSWDEVSRSDALFLGRLVDADTVYAVQTVPWIRLPMSKTLRLGANRAVLTFEVERWWQGSGEPFVEVLTDLSSCGLYVERMGQDMLIEGAAYKGTLFTYLCMRSLRIYEPEEAKRLREQDEPRRYWRLTRDSLQTYLGAGEPPSPPQQRGWIWWMGGALAASVVVGWYVKHRRI